MKQTVHFFSDSGEAYDDCQCDEQISTGDVLVVESENIIGICHTWPFAITSSYGKLHTLKPGVTVAQLAREDDFPDNSELAMRLAATFHFTLKEAS